MSSPSSPDHRQDETFWDKVKCDASRYTGIFKPSRPKLLVALQLLFFAPGFQLALSLRIQQLLIKVPLFGKILRRIIWYVTTIMFGSEIDPNCTIGSGIYFPHPYGIVIGGECVIGKHVCINQNVTIGRKTHADIRNPTIEDGATLYTGSVIIGPVTIGKQAVVGANSVVTKDVPAGATAVGIPARVLNKTDAQP